MREIEGANSSLKDVLPKDYGLPSLDKRRLGDLIEMISDIEVGDKESRSKDMLGRVYEYFLSQFASAEGKRGGEFYTPRCIVNLLLRCSNRIADGFTILVGICRHVRAVDEVHRAIRDWKRKWRQG